MRTVPYVPVAYARLSLPPARRSRARRVVGRSVLRVAVVDACRQLVAGGEDVFSLARVHEVVAAGGVVRARAVVGAAVRAEVTAGDGALVRVRPGWFGLRGAGQGPEPVRAAGAGRRSAVEHVLVAVTALAADGRVRVTRRDVEARLGETGCPYSWRAVHGALRSLALTRPDLIGVGGHGWYRVGGPGTEDRSGRPVGGR